MYGIPTNCGFLTPQFADSCFFPSAPDITHSHIPYFARMLCNWAYNIPNKFSWVMVITAHNESFLKSRIKNVLPNYEPPGWKIANSVDSTWTDATQNVVGCIFAQGVSIPGENVNIEYAGITEGSNRGFLNAPIINGRASLELLNAGFLETNRSFVDGVLRPWAILASHEGLLARNRQQSIKSDIQVYELAKSGDECSSNIIRKIFTYYNCVPVFISSEEKDYSSSGDYPKLQVKFVYTHYTVDDLSSAPPKLTAPSSSFQETRPKNFQIGEIAQINSKNFGNPVKYIA